MKDIIFIVGPSGIGKTTLAKKLFNYFKSVYIEQHMIPEFITQNGKDEVVGEFEEETLWTSMVALINNFSNLNYKNIIALDFDDSRCRDIPEIFRGTNFIIIKLISSNYEQNSNQMQNRKHGLIDIKLLEESTKLINNRDLLINEYSIDIANKSEEQVFSEALNLICKKESLINYNYVKPNKKLFYTWVKK